MPLSFSNGDTFIVAYDMSHAEQELSGLMILNFRMLFVCECDGTEVQNVIFCLINQRSLPTVKFFFWADIRFSLI